MVEATNNAVAEKTAKLKSVFPGFKSISDKIRDSSVSPEFWKKEQENIIKAVRENKKWKESMKMSWEKYHQEFTI